MIGQANLAVSKSSFSGKSSFNEAGLTYGERRRQQAHTLPTFTPKKKIPTRLVGAQLFGTGALGARAGGNDEDQGHANPFGGSHNLTGTELPAQETGETTRIRACQPVCGSQPDSARELLAQETGGNDEDQGHATRLVGATTGLAGLPGGEPVETTRSAMPAFGGATT